MLWVQEITASPIAQKTLNNAFYKKKKITANDYKNGERTVYVKDKPCETKSLMLKLAEHYKFK